MDASRCGRGCGQCFCQPRFAPAFRNRRVWTNQLLQIWSSKSRFPEALKYVDHVTIDLREAHDPYGRFIGGSVLDIRRILKVPPHFELSYGEDWDRDKMEKALEDDVARYGKSIRPCRFCLNSAQDESLRFLESFKSSPIPPALPAEFASQIDISKLRRERKKVKSHPWRCLR